MPYEMRIAHEPYIHITHFNYFQCGIIISNTPPSLKLKQDGGSLSLECNGIRSREEIPEDWLERRKPDQRYTRVVLQHLGEELYNWLEKRKPNQCYTELQVVLKHLGKLYYWELEWVT